MQFLGYLRRSRLIQKLWISQKEVPKYLKLIIWIFGADQHNDAFVLLGKRVCQLWTRSGSNFAFLYLKEATRLVTRYLAGQAEPDSVNRILVKRDHLGLPTIVPLSLRKILIERRDEKLIRGIITALSIYRVMSTSVLPKLDTVTDPFSGTATTIDNRELLRALELLRINGIRLKSIEALLLASAGPNGFNSAWSAATDAIAYLLHPLECYHLFKYMWFAPGGWFYILWMVLIWLFSPLYFFGKFIQWCTKVPTEDSPPKHAEASRLKLGKLSVVRDQAGKARIVAVTNWWIQVALKPLHNALFSSLSRIDQDGTFDQSRPLDLLIERVPEGQTFHSFDLSAATDRLPIELQEAILNLINYDGLGSRWASALRIPWWWQSSTVHYSVGQPIGAYSSWAMLALTHHIIVKVAALRAGLRDFYAYALLGDDIVIAHDAVAEQYLELIEALGVSINLSKSLQSKDFCEFAKVLKGHRINYTPIGPGLLLRSLRDAWYMPALFCETIRIGITNLPNALAVLSTCPRHFGRKQAWNIMWSVFGLTSPFILKSRMDVRTIMWCFSTRVDEVVRLRYCIWNSLLQLRLNDKRRKTSQLDRQLRTFTRNLWISTIVGRANWPQRLLETATRLISPGFWTNCREFVRDREALTNFSIDSIRGDGSWETIRILAGMDPMLNVTNVDWTSKDQVRAVRDRAKELFEILEQTWFDVEGIDFSEFNREARSYKDFFIDTNPDYDRWYKEHIAQLRQSAFDTEVPEGYFDEMYTIPDR